MKTKCNCRLFTENSQHAILSDVFAKAASSLPYTLGMFLEYQKKLSHQYPLPYTLGMFPTLKAGLRNLYALPYTLGMFLFSLG